MHRIGTAQHITVPTSRRIAPLLIASSTALALSQPHSPHVSAQKWAHDFARLLCRRFALNWSSPMKSEVSVGCRKSLPSFTYEFVRLFPERRGWRHRRQRQHQRQQLQAPGTAARKSISLREAAVGGAAASKQCLGWTWQLLRGHVR